MIYLNLDNEIYETLTLYLIYLTNQIVILYNLLLYLKFFIIFSNYSLDIDDAYDSYHYIWLYHYENDIR